jgi:hypothetical protein
MKKILSFLFILTTISAVGLKAQDNSDSGGTQEAEESKWYVKLYGDYGFSIGGSTKPNSGINYNFSSISNSSSTVSNYHYTYTRKGLGSGLRAGLGVGYILNDYLNIGLDLEKYWSGDITRNYVSNSTTPTNIYTAESNTTYNSSILSLNPNITLKGITNTNYYFYIRAGLVLGIAKSYTQNYVYKNSTRTLSPSSTTTDGSVSERKFSGGLPIGYNLALGFQFKLTKKVRFFIELQNYYVSYAPTKSELTKSTSENNGTVTDNLPGYTINQKQTEYSTDYTTDSNASPFQPSKDVKTATIYHSLGIGFGLTYRF